FGGGASAGASSVASAPQVTSLIPK
ncbi:MAG: hypothetical protein K0Q97_2294, partial [Bacillota bacterium]|nr:hypothetical protein [Bacillota bacterium]